MLTHTSPPRIHPFAQRDRLLRDAFFAVECPETVRLTPAALHCALAAREAVVAEMVEAGWTPRELWRKVNMHDVKEAVFHSIIETHRHRTPAEAAAVRVLALAFWQRAGHTVHPAPYVARARELGVDEAEIALACDVAHGKQ